MVFLEDQSQPLRSLLCVDGVTDTYKIFHATETTQRLSVRLSVNAEALRRRRGLSVTDVRHFTQEYKLGLRVMSTHCLSEEVHAPMWLPIIRTSIKYLNLDFNEVSI